MPNITITMKNGTKKEFKYKGRSGGSYENKIEYVPGFVVLTDEWNYQTVIPANDIQEIQSCPIR